MLSNLLAVGMPEEVKHLGNRIGLNWDVVWELVNQYGMGVLTLLPQLIPLIQAQNWAGVLALIVTALHTTPPPIVPVPTPAPAPLPPAV